MCGIAGLFVPDADRGRIQAELEAMSAALVHRGPDDAGILADDGGGLAMRRLAIIDVRGGHQPQLNESGDLAVVMNGEIYNFKELRRRLTAGGHVFRTGSDTETVVHCFEDAPTAFARDLRGMFALAVWDRRDGSVTLAVDPLGIKPLYYVAAGSRLVFASELGSLLAGGSVQRLIDPQALSEYFAFGYSCAPGTIYRGVRRLEPGHVLRWAPGRGGSLARYWDLPAPRPGGRPAGEAAVRAAGESAVRPGAEPAAAVRELLGDAVRSHMVSDVPVGAMLSGGVDSSAVVALMSEASGAPVRTFTVGFTDPRHDERAHARRIATRFGCDHHEVVLQPASVDTIPQLVGHFGEPFADPAALPMYFVSQLAREHVKVALSGDGADELFLGYTYFRGLEVTRRLQGLPGWARRGLVRSGEDLLGTRLAARSARADRFGRRLAASGLSLPEAFLRKISLDGAESARICLAQDVVRALEARPPLAPYGRAWREYRGRGAGDALETLAYGQMKVSLPDDMLCKVDRMSMAHSLEVRVPFLDQALVEYVSSLPMAQRFPGRRLKGLLREALRDTLPGDVLDRPKHGFTVPLPAWFRGDLVGYARELLLSSEARASGFYDPAAVDRLIGDHAGTRRQATGGLWTLIVFEAWRSSQGVDAGHLLSPTPHHGLDGDPWPGGSS